MLLLAALLPAFADPADDPWLELRAHVARAHQVDQVQGLHPSGLADALQWPWEDELDEALRERLGPELEATEGAWRPGWAVRPLAWTSEGPLEPSYQDGDAEPGLLSIRAGVEASAWSGPVEARVVALGRVDAWEHDAVGLGVEQWRLGVRTTGFWAAMSQESRWIGPGRQGALLLTDNARPLPGGEIGATWRFPGRGDRLGRFAAQLALGWIPEARRGPDRPGWLAVDLRWQPVPWIEAGATRRALFGGYDDGELRPIDLGQLILPTRPHVEDDPERLEHDSDEAASLDLRVSAPIGRWLDLPVDYVELYVQHGGEDIIARSLGPLPWPSLAGVANLYGAGLAGGPWFARVEHAVIEDDVFRWYVGHRLYHDGWTHHGRVMGHARGGDARSWQVRVVMKRVCLLLISSACMRAMPIRVTGRSK